MKAKTPISQLLSAYRPHPGRRFYQRMENAPWVTDSASKTEGSFDLFRLKWQWAIAALLLLILLSFGIPSVRAAISTWLGLSVAPSNQMPAEAVTLTALNPSTPPAGAVPSASQASSTPAELPSSTPRATTLGQPIQITTLSPQVDWKILAPGYLPAGYHFESAYYDTNHKMVVLTYLATRPLPGAADPSLTASTTITLLQAQSNDFVPMQIAPATNIEDVAVNGRPAAYALGAWDTQFVRDDRDPQGGRMVSTWRNDLKIQNLYWQVGKVYLALIGDDGALSRQELIAIAASMGE